MMRKTIVVVGGIVLSLAGFAEPTIKDRSVLGRWTFNDGASSADVSGWGGSAFTAKSGTMSFKDSGSFDGTGYLDITASGTATATLGGGNALGDSAYQTVFVRYKSNCSVSVSGDSNTKAFLGKLNDKDDWHLVLLRYQGYKAAAGTWGSTTWRSAVDPTTRAWWDTSPRADVGNDSKIMIPASVSGSTVTVGGNIGVSSYTTGYKGGIDEVVVIGRLMSMDELSRYYQTGETYVYPTANGPAFADSTGWSSIERNWKPKPGDMVGAAYIIDGGNTLSQSATATFGGSTDKGISLTLGRLSALAISGGSVGTVGNFTQSGSGTAITFYDLRLNDGTITAGGASLTTTLLDVEAPSTKPFVLTAANDFALAVSEATTGVGVLVKKGNGKLTVSQWTGTAKLRIEEGSIRTARLDGYAGGTVLVSTDSSVAFTGDDVLPTAGNKMKIAFDGVKPTAKIAVMTVPNGITASMVQDATEYDAGKVGIVTVENGTVYVKPGYPEDEGAVPVLMAE